MTRTSPRAVTIYDIVELLESVAATRWHVNDDSCMNIFAGADTVRWVERWNQTNGYWRRGNPRRYNGWDEV
jgi:hypothetical protein